MHRDIIELLRTTAKLQTNLHTCRGRFASVFYDTPKDCHKQQRCVTCLATPLLFMLVNMDLHMFALCLCHSQLPPVCVCMQATHMQTIIVNLSLMEGLEEGP